MEFHPSALAAKVRWLDGILREEHLLRAVLERRAGGAAYRYEHVARPWEPGGGATLFVVTIGTERCFLKVKACAVTVESKLESEARFSELPALRNEFAFLERVKGLSPNLPQRFEYEEEGEYGFLFLEYLSEFSSGVEPLSARELVDAYEQIEETVRRLHAAGIVHTDVHEKNLLFRGKVPVLVDFEEARELRQDLPFAESLDVVGRNRYGDVGDMPLSAGNLPGRTCLARLRAVVTALLRPRLEALVRQSRFDSSCPYLTALDHGVDERVYQSIDVPGLQVVGQRPLADARLDLIRATAEALFDRPYVHLDIGCNVGRFNLELAKDPKVEKTIGVDAAPTYVDLATCLAFASEASKATFLRAEVGKDRLAELLRDERIDLVTVYSVYHHVAEREAFLADLRQLRPRHVLFELAVQPECYGGRRWQEEMEIICHRLGMAQWRLVGQSGDYARPLVLVSPAAASTEAGEHRPGAGSPRVSVVLPTYNHVEFLPRAVESLRQQTFGDFELIIVDDGSTDGTRAYLASLTDPRIRVIHQDNQRLPRALNAGFAVARGALLTWISADNYAAPLFLEALVGALDAHPEAGLAFSAFAWIDERDRITGIHRDQDFSCRSLLAQNPGNASFLYRRACQEQLGPYDPGLEGAEDWDMWLRLVERFPTVYVPEVLYYYRVHERSMTAERREQVARASRQVFVNAMARRQGHLTLEELYPTLRDCRDPEAARFHAWLDLGAVMLRSPFAGAGIAVQILEEARKHAPDSLALAGNLAVALARAGEWQRASALTRELEATGDPTAREIAGRVEDACRQQQPALLAAVPLYAPDRTRLELFRLERERARVYSLTACLPAERAAPAETPVARPAPSEPPPEPAAGAAETGSDQPLVSVIVPTFNRLATLREALESILGQRYPNVEIVVVNDAGADAEHVVAELAQRGHITYIRHARNRGLAAARNTGLAAARGKYVAYLDDDDRFYPEHLETLVRFLETTSYRAAYADAWRVHQVREGDRYVDTGRDLPYSRDFDPDALLVANYFPVLSVVHERALLDEVGAFDESLTSHEDWDLWIRMSRRWPFAHVKATTGEFTCRADGSTMTSSMRADYRRTIEIIHRRYRAHAEPIPGAIEAQRRFLASLEATHDPARFDYSVIMPVWNRCELTRQCIEALARVTNDVRFELIVVDNGSTDDTGAFLASVGGDLHVIRNAENRGFARACNQGARAARGRYLVFLNNDTVPLSGWLEALGAEADGDPEVAVVGSKLLYGDGTVQHAGLAFTRRERLPYHIYAHCPGNDPAVDTRQELQAVTGACMLVRREVFEQLGGFDEGFVNGFEDVDLCLRVRDQGRRVVYQPRSVLYHFESQTPGRKAHDAPNMRRFFERWGARWWLVDEDAVYVARGYAARMFEREGKRYINFVPLTDAAERHRWELVAETQRAAQRRDLDTVCALLRKVEDWPDDPEVLEWAASVCRQVGMADHTPAFWLKRLGASSSGATDTSPAAATSGAA